MKPKPLDPHSAETERAVCDLRASGLTFEEISSRLGLSGKGQAHKIYQRALIRIPAESVEELRFLEADRLDRG